MMSINNNHKHSNHVIDDDNDPTIISSLYTLHEMLFTKKRNVNMLTLKLYLQLYPESVMIPYRCYPRNTNDNCCCQKRQKKEENTNVIKGIDHDDKSVVELTTPDDDEECHIENNKLPLPKNLL